VRRHLRLHARLASPGGGAAGGRLANLLGAGSCARMRVLNEDLMMLFERSTPSART
jgi:hypothetical protein